MVLILFYKRFWLVFREVAIHSQFKGIFFGINVQISSQNYQVFFSILVFFQMKDYFVC